MAREMMEKAVGSKQLPWNRADIFAILGLFSYWLFKSSALLADYTHRHFAMRLSIDDLFSQYWATWWAGRALTGLEESIHFSPILNYPVGADYFGAQPNYLHELLAGWLHMTWGGIPAANTVALGALLFSLLAFYLLFRHLAGSRVMGLLLSVLVASYSLFFDNQLLDLSLSNAGFLVLAVYFWLRTAETPHWKWAGATVAFALLTGLGHLYYGAMLLGLFLLALPFAALGSFHGDGPRRRSLIYTVAIILATVVLVILVLWGPLATIRGVGAGQGDMTALVMRRIGRFEVLMGATALLALAAFTWFLRGKGSWFWLTATTSLYIFALGDYYPSTVQQGMGGIWSEQITLPLGWLLRTIPFGWRFTHPDRLALAGLLSAGCLTALLWRRFNVAQFVSPLLSTQLRKSLVFGAALALLLPQLGASATFRLPGSLTQATTSGGRPLVGFRDPHLAHLVCSGESLGPAADPPSEKVWQRYLWLFQPLEYFEFPPIPAVISQLQESNESYALLEVAGATSFLSLYYQTAHNKGIGGFHQPPHLNSAHPVSPLTLAHRQINLEGSFAPLLLPSLQELNVRYVFRFKGANRGLGGNWCPPPGELPWGMAALTVPYLRLIHDDELVQIWQVQNEPESR
jgi:hypothetical protein